jgi:hypothetical protein
MELDGPHDAYELQRIYSSSSWLTACVDSTTS